MTNTSALTIVIVAVVSCCCLSPLGSGVFARNLEPLSNSAMANLLGTSSQQDSIVKRSIFDPSCKGYYNREIFQKLNRVCDDCYNLYRKPSVSVKCKSDCFGNPVFEQCLYDLLRQNEADDFSKIIRTLGK